MKSYLSPEFIYFITDFKFVTFSFDYIDWDKFDFSKSETERLDYDQPDPLFIEFGYESGSFVVNQSGILLLFVVVAILHVVFLVAYLI